MTEPLNPCPHCGSLAEEGDIDGVSAICCKECSAACVAWYRTEDGDIDWARARADWNVRVSLECECGGYGTLEDSLGDPFYCGCVAGQARLARDLRREKEQLETRLEGKIQELKLALDEERAKTALTARHQKEGEVLVSFVRDDGPTFWRIEAHHEERGVRWCSDLFRCVNPPVVTPVSPGDGWEYSVVRTELS